LDTILHSGPSPLSINSIYLSEGALPEVFVKGTGAPDTFLEYMHALTTHPSEYYPCLISYSRKDQAFAERLYADLQRKNVRCWYAPEDLKGGARLRHGMDEAIRLHEKLLLILSKHALASGWVEQEIKTALARERQEKKTILFPLRLDNAISACAFAWATEIRRERTIGNFTHWKHHESYQQSLQRLLRDLKVEAT
jgi:TIR domain